MSTLRRVLAVPPLSDRLRVPAGAGGAARRAGAETFRALSSANRWSLHTYEVLARPRTHVREGHRRDGGRVPRLRADPRPPLSGAVARRDAGHPAPRGGRHPPPDRPTTPRSRRGWTRPRPPSASGCSCRRARGVLRPETSREAALAPWRRTRRAPAARSEAVERARRALDEMEARRVRPAARARRPRHRRWSGAPACSCWPAPCWPWRWPLATAVMVERRTRRLAEVNRAAGGRGGPARHGPRRPGPHEPAERAHPGERRGGDLRAGPPGLHALPEPRRRPHAGPRARRRHRPPLRGRAGHGRGARRGATASTPSAPPCPPAWPREVKDAAFRRADGSSFPVEYASTPIVEEGQHHGRRGHLSRRDGAARGGADEGRVRLRREPRAAHAAHLHPRLAGAAGRRQAGRGAREGAADAGDRRAEHRPAGAAHQRHPGHRAHRERPGDHGAALRGCIRAGPPERRGDVGHGRQGGGAAVRLGGPAAAGGGPGPHPPGAHQPAVQRHQVLARRGRRWP